jgi:hypothetical protein
MTDDAHSHYERLATALHERRTSRGLTMRALAEAANSLSSPPAKSRHCGHGSPNSKRPGAPPSNPRTGGCGPHWMRWPGSHTSPTT